MVDFEGRNLQVYWCTVRPKQVGCAARYPMMKNVEQPVSARTQNIASKLDVETELKFLHEMVRSANGMLPIPVYEALWSWAGQAPGPNFLEVGTAHGAGTIALAFGARKAGLDVKIQTIDRLGGKFSSRSGFGSVEQNKAVVQENFARANVAQCIALFVGTTDEFVSAGHTPDRIDLLMLDADGRIDRDLMHFYDRLTAQAVIVVDDVDPEIFLGTAHDGTPYLDLKHRITSLLLAAFESAGYLRVEKRIGCTAFCRRGNRDMDRQAVLQMAVSCYRELVFVDLPEGHWRQLIQWHSNRAKVQGALRIRAMVPEVIVSLGRLGLRMRRRLLK
jgi:predicted O-methyltransferase YrrM